MKPKWSAVFFLSLIVGLATYWASGRSRGAEAYALLAPAPQFDTLVGTFDADGISITLSRTGPNYTGVIHKGQAAFPLTGDRVADARHRPRVQGAFIANGHEFPFDVALDDDEALLTSSGTEYRLRRVNNPMARAETPVTFAAE